MVAMFSSESEVLAHSLVRIDSLHFNLLRCPMCCSESVHLLHCFLSSFAGAAWVGNSLAKKPATSALAAPTAFSTTKEVFDVLAPKYDSEIEVRCTNIAKTAQ